MIRWAVSGTGTMASNFIKDGLHVDSGEFIAVYSQTIARAEQFAGEHQLSQHYDDFQQMLANPDIDAVYIASTHQKHAPQAIAALNAGKHVLVEKPMSLSLAEAEAVFAAASANQRYCAEALWTKFNPAFKSVVAQINDGRIGEVRHIQASFGFAFDANNTQHRLLNPEHAGGALLDIGLYPIILPLTVFGTPLQTQARVEMGPTGVDIAGDLILDYSHNRSASLSYRFDANLPTKATISGSEGWVELDAPWFASRTAHWKIGHGEIETEEFEMNCTGWGLVFAAVNDDIAAGRLESAVHSWQDSLQLAGYLQQLRDRHGPKYPFE